MKNLKFTIVSGLLAISLLTSSVSYASVYPVQVQQFQLIGSGATSGDTTLTLNSFNDTNGNPLTMAQFGTMGFGTIEPNNGSQEENIDFTGITNNSNGSVTLTGINDITLNFPFTLTGNLTKNHAGASTFVISANSYFFYSMFPIIQNNSNITGFWTVPDPVSPQGIASRNYVDGKSFGGIGGATETATGTVQIATNLQAASSTKNGSVGRLAIPSSIATSTCANTTNALNVIVTTNSGQIDSSCIGGGNNATFMGTTTFSNTATSSTIFTATSSLQIGSFPAYKIGKNATSTTVAGTYSFVPPQGIQYVDVECVGGGGGGGSANSAGVAGGGGGAGAYAEKVIDVTGTSSIVYRIGKQGIAISGDQNGTQGSSTIMSSYFTVAGGNPGGKGTNGAGGSGGAATSGADFSYQGGEGISSIANTAGVPGVGGSSYFGGPGDDAGPPGAGGSGQQGTSGKDGDPGACIFRW